MALNTSRFDVTRINGDTRTINSQSIEVIQTDDNDNVEIARGDVVITDGGSGYAVGCLYVNTSGSAGSILYVNEGSTTSCNFNAIDPSATGGGGSGLGLDEAYSINRAVTVDEGASTWTDSSTGALNTFELVKSGAGSGNLLDLSIDAAMTGNAIALDMNLGIAAVGVYIDNGATARTGADIQVNDDSTGAHSVIDINSSGSGASIGFDWTGSYNGSPGGSAVSLTFDNADNLDTEGVLITRGTGVRTASAISIVDSSTGSDDVINIDISGVLTGDVIDITTSAAATGNALFVNLDSAVAMTAIHVEGSGVRTQPFIELITDATGAADLIDISVDGAVTGDAIDIDLNLGLACRALYIDAGNGTRTANLIDILHDGDGNVDVFGITYSNTGSGSVFDIDMSGASTGSVMNVDMNAAVGASFLILDYGAGTRTEDMCQVTYDGDGTNPFWDIDISNTGAGGTTDYWDIDVSGVFTGSILDVTYSAAATGDCIAIDMTSAVAAKAGIYTAAGARTDDLFEINDSSTGNSHIFDINMSGIYTGNVIDITYSASAATGNAIDLNMGTNVAGMAISVASAATGTAGEGSAFDIAHTGDLAANADVVRVYSSGSPSSTSNLVSIVQDTGAGNAGAYGLHVSCSGTNVEAAHFETGEVYVEEALRYVQKAETVTSANVITAAETGSVFFLNSATEFASTLPAPAAGLHYTFIVTGAPSGANYTITTNASANIIIGAVHESSGGDGDSETSGADTINFVDSIAVVGDQVDVYCDGTNWFARCFCDAAGGITITTVS